MSHGCHSISVVCVSQTSFKCLYFPKKKGTEECHRTRSKSLPAWRFSDSTSAFCHRWIFFFFHNVLAWQHSYRTKKRAPAGRQARSWLEYSINPSLFVNLGQNVPKCSPPTPKEKNNADKLRNSRVWTRNEAASADKFKRIIHIRQRGLRIDWKYLEKHFSRILQNYSLCLKHSTKYSTCQYMHNVYLPLCMCFVSCHMILIRQWQMYPRCDVSDALLTLTLSTHKHEQLTGCTDVLL